MGPSSGKERRNFRAIARASFRFPELKAGWPQHVWERGTRTVAPNRSSTSTVAVQTPGEKASARQVKKRDTGMGPLARISHQGSSRGGGDGRGSIPVVYVMRSSPRLQSLIPPLDGPDPFAHHGHQLVVHCRLYLHLGDEVDHVLRPAVHLGVPLLPPEPLHFEDGHSGHAHLGERLLHLVHLERLDDRFDLFHRMSPGPCRLSGGSSAG